MYCKVRACFHRLYILGYTKEVSCEHCSANSGNISWANLTYCPVAERDLCPRHADMIGMATYKSMSLRTICSNACTAIVWRRSWRRGPWQFPVYGMPHLRKIFRNHLYIACCWHAVLSGFMKNRLLGLLILRGLQTAKTRLNANVNFDLTMELLFLLIKENLV